jgi:hypothetical protein
MLEGLRVGKSYQILRLLSGLSEPFRKSMHLENFQENPFVNPISNTKDERDKVATDFEKIMKAFW